MLLFAYARHFVAHARGTCPQERRVQRPACHGKAVDTAAHRWIGAFPLSMREVSVCSVAVGEIEGEAVPCHTELQTRHGIWNIENLDFEPLLAG